MLGRKIQTLGGLCRAVFSGEPSPVVAAALRGAVNPMQEICKRETLRHYAKKFGTRIFIETGTFRGETMDFLAPGFDRLISIELSQEHFASAKNKFLGRPKFELHNGDSAEVLPDVITSVASRALIWLDAHYSGKTTALGPEETPIIRELEIVFSLAKTRHVILIDDAREFGPNPNYPPLGFVEEVARKNGFHFECRFDLIRLTP